MEFDKYVTNIANYFDHINHDREMKQVIFHVASFILVSIDQSQTDTLFFTCSRLY